MWPDHQAGMQTPWQGWQHCSIEGQQIDSVHVIRRDHHTPFCPADYPAQETDCRRIPVVPRQTQSSTTGTLPGYDQEATRVKRITYFLDLVKSRRNGMNVDQSKGGNQV